VLKNVFGRVGNRPVNWSQRKAARKSARDRAVAAADYARKSSVLPVEMDPIAIDRFTPMREQLTSGDVARVR